MNDLNGQSFGRYHLVEKLGEGGMAVVYKAFDTRLECDVAVKVIRMERLSQEMMATTLKRFEREAKAVAQLTHPNIVKVTDFGEANDIPYLVMVYLPGGTLKQFLGEPMPYPQALRLLEPVAQALSYAHSHKIIHRDVKPSNILITESGQPMLTDFGIAKILDLQDGQTLTGTGVGIGTPEYMAPEQWTGEITPAVDIYSLGVVLYELVTGHKPYTADTPAAVLIKTINDPLPRPSSFAPGIPESVEQVIYKAMAKKAGDRFASMTEFEAALNLLAREERTSAKTAGATAVVAPSETPAIDSSDELATSQNLAENFDQDETKVEDSQVEPNQAALSIQDGELPNDETPLEEKAVGKPHEKDTDEQSRPIETVKKKRNLLWVGLGIFAAIGIFLIVGFTTSWFTRFGSTRISSVDGMQMVYVPAGEFIMGSPYGQGDTDEHPLHTVYLDAFWIDKTEVTNAMYAKCVEAGACSEHLNDSSSTRSSYYDNPEFKNYPVIGIRWDQADIYCRWAGRTLPTEAQWEKAARGVNGQYYPWGDQQPNQSFVNFDDSFGDTTEVGSFPEGASPYGALDMAGNVWEWVSDWYDEDYYAISPSKNPTGNNSGLYILSLRGGSWWNEEYFLRSANRFPNNVILRSDDVGFRCASPK
jgi:serine/threonine-protein kinase